MRSLSTAFATEIAKEAFTAGILVQVEMPDGSFVRSSSLGVLDIVYGGSDYSGAFGFDISSLTMADSETQPSLDGMTAAGEVAPFTFDQAASGILQAASVTVMAYLPDANGGAGAAHILGSKWYIAGTDLADDGEFDIELKSSSDKTRQLTLPVYSPTCRWSVGDAGCGVSMASFTDTVTIATNPDLFTVTITGSSRADGAYAFGAIKFTSGAMTGRSFPVLSWDLSSGTVTLAVPLNSPVAAGDVAQIHVGCPGDADTCADTFSNSTRRFAFSNLPDENLSWPQADAVPATSTDSSQNSFFEWWS